METMNKLKRLGVFGVLNYEMLSNMPDDKRRGFVRRSVNESLLKKMKGDNPIAIEEDTIYEINMEYQAIDIHYNLRGRLLAVLTCQREGQEFKIKFESINYKPIK